MSLDRPEVFLSLLIFLPALAAFALACIPGSWPVENFRRVTLGATVLTLVLALSLLGGWTGVKFDAGEANMQHLVREAWIPTFGIEYLLGVDGISLPLVVLTAGLCVLAMITSWNITKHVKGYCILFLLLETGMLGVFLALDFFLFYVFWEVMLLPMYFLIGIWGGPRKEYAAIKFFLYTLFGSVLMLVAILMLYFASDLRELSPSQLAAAGVIDVPVEGTSASPEVERLRTSPTPVHTFNILALQQLGQHTSQFSSFGAAADGTPRTFLGHSLEWWAFVLLLIGFIIKVPSVPLHTWLPDAHVEAPTPISMLLAGVLLKMGGYGILRICLPVCPQAASDLAYVLCTIGVVSMVYGAFAALAQTDFKRLVAYSSVSHMGYVVLGMGVWSAVADTQYDTQYWKMGMNGAMYQMIAHGVSSAGMFFMVGVLYDRVHHRDLGKFGGLFARMPVYSGLALGIFFAGLGLPGLCGFIGEVLVVLATWKFSVLLAVISAAVVILTAAYILWTIQRVYLGADYRGPHGEALTPITARELTVAVPLLVFAVLFGVYPPALLNWMQPSIDNTVEQLADWQRTHDGADLATVARQLTGEAAP